MSAFDPLRSFDGRVTCQTMRWPRFITLTAMLLSACGTDPQVRKACEASAGKMVDDQASFEFKEFGPLTDDYFLSSIQASEGASSLRGAKHGLAVLKQAARPEGRHLFVGRTRDKVEQRDPRDSEFICLAKPATSDCYCIPWRGKAADNEG